MTTKKKISQAVLVSMVDDDASVRNSTMRLLRCTGIRAEAFDSAEAFLSSEFLDETACLLLDVRMPGMDGLQLQERLLQLDKRIPIIFLSSRASEKEETRACQAGAIDFLRKPVGKEVLLRAINSVLEHPINNSSKDL